MTTLANGLALIKAAIEMTCIHYWVLEIRGNATDEEIRKSFHNKSKIYHPDKPTGNKELFQQLQAAYELLSDHKDEHDAKLITRNDCSEITLGPKGEKTSSSKHEISIELEDVYFGKTV